MTEKDEVIKIDFITSVVQKYYGLDYLDLLSKSRKENDVQVRYIVFYLIYTYKLYNKIEIARMFGLNHATIIHALKKIENMQSSYEYFAKEIREIMLAVKHEQKIEEIDLKENYLIDLNNCFSLKVSEEKAIVFTGYTKSEAERLTKNVFSLNRELVEHRNTTLILLEKKNENN